VIRQLREGEVLPIQRAQMRVRVSAASKEGKRVAERARPLFAQVEHEEFGAQYELVGVLDPGHFRALDEVVSAETKGRGTVDVLSLRESAADAEDAA
jgi:ribosome maturation protein SDO1